MTKLRMVRILKFSPKKYFGFVFVNERVLKLLMCKVGEKMGPMNRPAKSSEPFWEREMRVKILLRALDYQII